jgi:hypothetical protein
MRSHPNLFQIVYSEETVRRAVPRHPVLDNTSSTQPDWFEYWPIRNFLKRQTPTADEYYGFFSPRLTEKTGLSLDDISQFVQQGGMAHDAYIFSPQPDMNAFFLNTFEQAETFDPGFLSGSEKVLRRIGLQVDLKSMVMDSRRTVYSNYMVARGAFWNDWLSICERIFALAESGEGEEAQFLRTKSTYPKGVQMKVFVVERIASLMLTMDRRWTTRSGNLFKYAWSASRLNEHPDMAILSDALKIAYNENGHPEYLEMYAILRKRFQSGRRGST